LGPFSFTENSTNSLDCIFCKRKNAQHSLFIFTMDKLGPTERSEVNPEGITGK
jgi:hypothetical protein